MIQGALTNTPSPLFGLLPNQAEDHPSQRLVCSINDCAHFLNYHDVCAETKKPLILLLKCHCAVPGHKFHQNLGFSWTLLPRDRGRGLSVDVTFEDAHGGAADPRDQAPTLVADFDMNLAGAPHLHSLRDP
jgi:hypothetical protein